MPRFSLNVREREWVEKTIFYKKTTCKVKWLLFGPHFAPLTFEAKRAIYPPITHTLFFAGGEGKIDPCQNRFSYILYFAQVQTNLRSG